MQNSNQKSANKQFQRALNSALRILTGRDHSKYELTQKLIRKGFTLEDTERAVAECERLDYINDERTSQVYIRQLSSKGYGLKRIRLEMSKKGLSDDVIQNILAEAISDLDEPKSAEQILRKNIRRFEREIDPKKKRAKVYRFLYSRGFSQDTIRKLLNNA